MSLSPLHDPPARARYRPTGPTGPARPAVALVPLARLRAHPDNVRRDLGDLRELVASIRLQGLLQPLRVEHPPGCEFLRIRAGHRRAAAAELAGLRTVPAVIVPECDTDEAITEMFAENLHRDALTAAEKRDNARRLVEEFGYTPDGIAAGIGVHPATVRGWLRTGKPTAPTTTSPRPSGGAGRRPRITPIAVHALIGRWSANTTDGLTAGQTRALLAEMAELLQGWEPTDTESAGAPRRVGS